MEGYLSEPRRVRQGGAEPEVARALLALFWLDEGWPAAAWLCAGCLTTAALPFAAAFVFRCLGCPCVQRTTLSASVSNVLVISSKVRPAPTAAQMSLHEARPARGCADPACAGAAPNGTSAHRATTVCARKNERGNFMYVLP